MSLPRHPIAFLVPSIAVATTLVFGGCNRESPMTPVNSDCGVTVSPPSGNPETEFEIAYETTATNCVWALNGVVQGQVDCGETFTTTLPAGANTITVSAKDATAKPATEETCTSGIVRVTQDTDNPPIETGQRILVFFARPGSEAMIAPYLAAQCVENDGECQFAVATKGESARCALPFGCSPDANTVRASEMLNSGEIFGANVIMGEFPDRDDNPSWEEVYSDWSSTTDGRPTIVDAIKNQITAFAPDLVLMFDPRHATACNPQERALAHGVLTALTDLGADAPEAKVFAHKLETDGSTYVGFSAAVPDDPLLLPQESAAFLWQYVADVISSYPSLKAGIFDPDIASQTPPNLQNIFVLDFQDAVAANNPAYDSLCQ